MKILILTTFPIKTTALELKNCKMQYHIFTYMLNKYLSGRGDEIILYQCTTKGTSSRFKDIVSNEKFPEADHAILVDNRGFLNRVDEFWDMLKLKIKGAICTFSASNVFTGNEDILYYMIPSGKTNKRRCKLIYWPCDHNLCSPRQDLSTLKILVDHNYYGHYKGMVESDKTKIITEQVCKFALDGNFEKPVKITRFIKGGVENVDPNNVTDTEKYVQGKGLNYEEACALYSSCDIFFVTHKECMGLSVLECAMAGCLIVAPKGYIKRELITKLNYVEFEGDEIPWEYIKNRLNIELSRKRALKFSWEHASERIYDTIKNFDKYRNRDLRFRNKH